MYYQKYFWPEKFKIRIQRNTILIEKDTPGRYSRVLSKTQVREK